MTKDDAHYQKDAQYQTLVNMHNAFHEALRHREQDIIRFVAILATALGGFVLILGKENLREPARFVAGAYGVLLILVVGAFYALALGYNYRYLTLQLSKLGSEACLDIEKFLLSHWPKDIEQFRRRCHCGIIPWCTPPGIIKVFWVAFVVSILGVTVVVSVAKNDIVWSETTSTQPTNLQSPAQGQPAKPDSRATWTPLLRPIPYVGGVCFLLSLLGPIHVGWKMLRACDKENPMDWRDRDEHAEDT